MAASNAVQSYAVVNEAVRSVGLRPELSNYQWQLATIQLVYNDA